MNIIEIKLRRIQILDDAAQSIRPYDMPISLRRLIERVGRRATNLQVFLRSAEDIQFLQQFRQHVSSSDKQDGSVLIDLAPQNVSGAVLDDLLYDRGYLRFAEMNLIENSSVIMKSREGGAVILLLNPSDLEEQYVRQLPRSDYLVAEFVQSSD